MYIYIIYKVYKRHIAYINITTISCVYICLFFGAGEETRVSKKREKNVIRHQITADANLSRPPTTAIDRFYTAVTLTRRHHKADPSPHPSDGTSSAPPLTFRPNRMCLQRAKTATLQVHPRCHAQAHLHARVNCIIIF